MTQSDHRDPSAQRRASDSDHVASLRGATPISVRRRGRAVVAALVVLVGVAIAASVVSAGRDVVRLDRLRSHGIPVMVTVVDCRGNLGGSGSNVVDYTCHATYRVDATTYHEVIGPLTSSRPAGATLRGVVDPSQHDYLVLASALRHRASPLRILLVPGLLVVGFVLALALSLWRVRRREGTRRALRRERDGSSR